MLRQLYLSIIKLRQDCFPVRPAAVFVLWRSFCCVAKTGCECIYPGGFDVRKKPDD